MSGYIYFLTDGEAIKIGYAKDVKARQKYLSVGNSFPLFLLGSIPGDKDDERMLHRKFGRYRLSGEWFQIHEEINDYLDHLDKAGSLIEGDDLREYAKTVNALGRERRKTVR